MNERRISGHGAFRVRGELAVPGDKSIAHRALIFGSLARGQSLIKGVPASQDIEATVACLSRLGVAVERVGTSASVVGLGRKRYSQPQGELDCGGSATTMRVLLGALTARGHRTTLVGNLSLSSRPMDRVIEPLSLMGARFDSGPGGVSPITIVPPEAPSAISFEMRYSSAQVKTALIAAALGAKGRTVISGAIGSRDHTERLVPRMGGSLVMLPDRLIVEGSELNAVAVSVPGDTSSAAFFAAAAALGRGSLLTVKGVGLNPTRMGFFEALSWMGGHVETEDVHENDPEPWGNLTVRWAPLKSIEVHADAIPFLVDEVPLVMLLATQAEGETTIRGVSELRLKETDRIHCAVDGLRSMGAEIEVEDNGVRVCGPTQLRSAVLDPRGDHRMSMMFTLAALVASGDSNVLGTGCEEKSFPEFWPALVRVMS